MRKSILLLLLATTSAMPALAQRSDQDRQAAREARAESRAERPQRAERAERPQRAERVERAARSERSVAPQVQVERQVQSGDQRSERMQRYQQQMQERQQRQAEGSPGERLIRSQRNAEIANREQLAEQWRQRRAESGQQVDGGVERERRVRPAPVIRPQVGQVGPVRTDVRRDRRDDRDGRYGRDGHRYDRDNRHRWVSGWRNDRRYDWRNHRNRHRSIFSLGFYFDPFGYNYSRFGIGSYLYPNYYRSNYWINDPWQYRLPPAYGPYRWIRYHNDAVLIDIYSGEVVDVIYGFFW